MIVKTLAPGNGVKVFTIMRITPRIHHVHSGKPHHGTLSNRQQHTSRQPRRRELRALAGRHPPGSNRLTGDLNRQFADVSAG